MSREESGRSIPDGGRPRSGAEMDGRERIAGRAAGLPQVGSPAGAVGVVALIAVGALIVSARRWRRRSSSAGSPGRRSGPIRRPIRCDSSSPRRRTPPSVHRRPHLRCRRTAVRWRSPHRRRRVGWHCGFSPSTRWKPREWPERKVPGRYSGRLTVARLPSPTHQRSSGPRRSISTAGSCVLLLASKSAASERGAPSTAIIANHRGVIQQIPCRWWSADTTHRA